MKMNYNEIMKHLGVPRRKKLKDEMKGFNTLASIMKGEPVLTYKRRKRAVETKPRDMAEKAMERKIIMSLKTMGCGVAKSGEQSTYNSHFVLNGMSDLIVFMPGNNVIFMEVKQSKYKTAKNGGLRKTQMDFQELCMICGVKYAVVYSVNEAKEIVKKMLAK